MMMMRSPFAAMPWARIRPWAALVLPPATWFVFEVGLAGSLRVSCMAVGAGLGAAWGVASLLLCALAVLLAWPPARRVDDQSPSPVWLARVAVLGAGVYALAISFQTIATLIVPSCAR